MTKPPISKRPENPNSVPKPGAKTDLMAPARVNEADLKSIRSLEASLGGEFCLVAVQKASTLFVVEAKLAPNEWEPIHRVYPGLEFKAYFTDHEAARLTKATLKTLLSGKLKKELVKRPIRIRRIEPQS